MEREDNIRLSFSHIRSFTVCDPTSLGAPLRSSLESPAERRRSACAAWASKAPGGADEASLDLHDLTSLCAARAASAACSLADVGVAAAGKHLLECTKFVTLVVS